MSWTRKNQYWVFQGVGWGSFAFIYLFFAFFFNQLGQNFVMRLGIFLFLGLALSHIMRLFIIRVGLLQKNLNRQVAVFVLLTFCISIIMSISYIGALWLTNLQKDTDTSFLHTNPNKFWFNLFLVILNNAFLCFILFFIWNLIYFVFHYVEKSRKQQLDTLKLESLVRDLELKTIKSHINPHFIFNALNSIRALVDENPQRAREAVTELSNILRSSMQSDKMEEVPFEEELAIVQDYLALETMRFEDRLKVVYEIDSNTLSLFIPPMMLQTLVENAIKHGVNKNMYGGVVRIISKIDGQNHIFSVENTGKIESKSSADGFGLASTTSRLLLLYGEKARFTIEQKTDELVAATVKIPLQGKV